MRYSSRVSLALALALLSSAALAQRVNDVQLRQGSSSLWGTTFNANNNQVIDQFNTAGSVVDSFRWYQGTSTAQGTFLWSISPTGHIAGPATGGRQGAGTINAAGLFVNGASAITGIGGSSGQIQYNNAGVLGGFTTSGDATINTASGVLTLASVNANVGTFGSATSCITTTANAKGLITAISAATCAPALGSITGLGTGVATALAINIGSAGAPVLFNGDGGTPSSIVLTNATGTAAGLTAGTASAVAVGGITGLSANCGTWLATASSANLSSCLTDETGTGVAVFGTAPVFTDSTTVAGSTGNAGFSIVSGDNNTAKIFSWRTANSRRWSARVDDNEAGANSGANWYLRRYNDAGTFIDSVMSCVRSTGICTFAFPIVGSGASLTALNAAQLSTGTIPAARTNGHQNGTATNDNAAAGEIGEVISSTITVGAPVNITTSGVAQNITSISLTAGDWDVSGSIGFIPAATTNVTQFIGSFSTTTGTLDTTPGRFFSFNLAPYVPGAAQQNYAMPIGRFSLSATTTVFFVAQSAFTVSTMGGFGIIRARRMR